MPLSYSSDDSLYTHVIWHCSEDINFFRSKLNLTSDELNILEKRNNSKKALEFLCSRLLLRLCKLDPNDLYYTEFGAPILKSGKFISINKIELENINNVSGVEITVSENSDLLEPPFGDKYLGFVFSQGESKEKVMESLTLAMNLANPIIK